MFIIELFKRIQFWKSADRIGPDIPWTHWRLYFKPQMRKLCMRKFKHFGENAEFRPMAYAECCSKISIGRNVVIRPGCMIYADPAEGGGGIHIEDDVLIGNNVHIYTDNHKFTDPTVTIADQGYVLSEGVILKKGCWIGSNAVLLPGITVGKNSVVGAGSVVTKSVPDFSVFAGAPARLIKTIS